jgi:alpha-tubulin suppressor-like RCC1 family protein
MTMRTGSGPNAETRAAVCVLLAAALWGGCVGGLPGDRPRPIATMTEAGEPGNAQGDTGIDGTPGPGRDPDGSLHDGRNDANPDGTGATDSSGGSGGVGAGDGGTSESGGTPAPDSGASVACDGPCPDANSCPNGMCCPGGGTCSGHGTCALGACTCVGGWTGGDCATPPACPGAGTCSGHGTCAGGACTCTGGWSGPGCDAPVTVPCPGGGNCSGHGTCSAGTCTCSGGWGGNDCSGCTASCVGQMCGADDGCGGKCTMGSCPAGQVCGGGGTPNQCGSGCAIQIATGARHTCAVRSDHTLWCWGDNYYGQLGDGTTTYRPSPVRAAALGANVAQVEANSVHTCARQLDGTLWCWGANVNGQVGDGTRISPRINPTQVSALGTSVAEALLGGEATYIGHTCARKSDGTLWCWGANSNGQIGDGTTTSPRPSPVQVTALGTSVAKIHHSAGAYHTCAIKTDGTAWCWGANGEGQLGNGMTAGAEPSPVQVAALGTSAAEIVAGIFHTCARKTEGSLWCWGANEYGELGDGTANSRNTPVQVTTLGTTVVEVAAGGDASVPAYDYTCARRTDGSVWCWGVNRRGQLGNGTTSFDPQPSPAQVLGLSASAAEISLGALHTCARKTDGTVWCWGANDIGQLGDGTSMDQHKPVQVPLECP